MKRNQELRFVRMSTSTLKPCWDRLFEIAGAQDGYFTTGQAAEAGYSTQLLLKHIRAGRVERTRRGIYRIVHFPAGEHDELVIAWLWSERAGIVSHQSALGLFELCDVLPSNVHLTLPESWRHRRLKVPPGVVLHHADVPAEHRTWLGAVPITDVPRTLNDCARDALSPELLAQAAHQALARGAVTRAQLQEVEEALRPFGGLE